MTIRGKHNEVVQIFEVIPAVGGPSNAAASRTGARVARKHLVSVHRFWRNIGVSSFSLQKARSSGKLCGMGRPLRAVAEALAKTQRGYPLRLFGDALMCNHFHLLSQPKPANR